jgi:hypothetical protein
LIWVAVVIVVLVVIDVVLVGLALGRNAPEQSQHAGPIPTYTTAPSPSPSPSPAQSTSAPAPSAKAIDSGRRMLSAVTATEAWRASGGSCGAAAPILERTTDGGVSWTPVELSGNISSIAGLRATAAAVSVLAGSGPDCTLSVRTSTDEGATWTDGDPGAAGPGISTTGVVLANGPIDSPCADPIDAFQGKTTTVIVCDGTVEWRTGTAPWVEVPMDGVRSVTVDGNAYTFARVGTDRCAGVRIETMSAVGVTPASMTKPVGCRPAVTDSPVEVDRVGRTVWLWVGQSVAVSHDGGVTW